jgi:predicted signal transduction protein with EAL and GGDEF domain
MIRLGHDHPHVVVAEGIETREIHDLVAQLGCDEGQGYWIAKPMPVEALDSWLKERIAAAPATDAAKSETANRASGPAGPLPAHSTAASLQGTGGVARGRAAAFLGGI